MKNNYIKIFLMLSMIVINCFPGNPKIFLSVFSLLLFLFNTALLFKVCKLVFKKLY